ncbi:5-methyltetrahydropteroyltriglutamate--homocysteine S-methyltransferase [Pseudodesulfovibrio sp.]|uniref:5-methyltetrahydropteroyltriglutamate-- homocysteine S-methyltransferase n=1 Tax=unclassified Pseudodesulfovibrio TaxID=2661612 RepID=UPI003AFFDDF1
MNAHVLGFPRMGSNRELKWALEKFWRGEISETDLLETADELKKRHWAIQAEAGMDLLPVGDFSFYDHVLDTAALLGAVPERFEHAGGGVDLATYFRMARGDAPRSIPAMEMTKWFDTNYHYIAPELTPDTRFAADPSRLLADAEAVAAMGCRPKPVLVGPFTFLLLAKELGGDRYDLLPDLIDAYATVLNALSGRCSWVQIDEPVLCTDLPPGAIDAFPFAYGRLSKAMGDARLLLTTYFGGMGDNLKLACSLPVEGLHVDLIRGMGEFGTVLDTLPKDKVLSLGLVDGRNIWRTDLNGAAKKLETARAQRGGDNIMIATSCSLLHTPVDIEAETGLDPNIKSWMAFAVQKCAEVAALKRHAEGSATPLFEENAAALSARAAHPGVNDPAVRGRADSVTGSMLTRSTPVAERLATQHANLGLPKFPTTTIGSYPQTTEIRRDRLRFKKGEIDETTYKDAMRGYIAEVVDRQHELGLDVLVHGEPERNDMVEYFGQQLDGFCFTGNGWVQSYGSRCVKPPVIYGDVSRPASMTVEWALYAQSLTDRPMKGMITGPVTILCWSFVRDDLPRAEVCRQLALAMRDEVLDLEKAGIHIIQIDEAALREGLPLRKAEQETYLRWAVDCFRLTSGGVADATQIHSHMCYSEFNAILPWIAAMDADVISIEASRSRMELLDAFETFDYPAEIGPGVYDIHSPRVPDEDEILGLLQHALKVIPADRLWVNPDCGLKTRHWEEVIPSLRNMVAAAKRLREDHAAV